MSDDQLNKDINTYSDERLADYRREFSNGLIAFRNWYFEQDEGAEPLFADFKTLVEHAGDQAAGPLGTLLRTPFSDAAAQIDITRTGFLTSLVKVIDAFSVSIRRNLQGQVAQRLTPDTRWADVRRVYQESGDWHEQLHLAGLPRHGSKVGEDMLSALVFAYRKWELSQHSAAYRGAYSMVDPDLRHLKASAAAEATRRLKAPSVNYGDVVLEMGRFELLPRQPIKIGKSVNTSGQVTVRMPLTPGVGFGVNVSGGVSGGFIAEGAFGEIMLEKVRVGLSYGQVAAAFGLFSTMVATSGLAALPAIALLANTRLRGTAELVVPASVRAGLFLELAMKIALDAGLAAGLSIDLAAIEGKLRARAGVDFGAILRAPVDIIADHGKVSFVGAANLNLSRELVFGLEGEVGAQILTVPWRKTWKLVDWRSGATWDTGTDLDLVYINGIQGDKSTIVSYDRIAQVLSQLKDLGGQMMNFTGPGAPAPTAPPRPNRARPLELAWPKPAADRYPNLYITVRGETRTQQELKEANRQGRPHILIYTPMRQRQLPHGGAPIGLGDFSKLGPGNNTVGPLVPGQTPGGEVMNSVVRPYGIVPTELNGDHVRDMQVGGENELGNMWPLPAVYNQAAGNRLKNARAVDTNVSPAQQIPLGVLKDLAAANPETAVFFFSLTSFDSIDFR